MFENVFDAIQRYKMFNSGDIVGVACSGGSDSMALLHFLNTNREKFDIEVIAIHVNHNTRENDLHDQEFVASYCREHGIRFYKFKIEALTLARKKGQTIEEACREGRYGIFENLKEKQFIDKLAIAHHQSDQAETVLMHILRGTGLNGASGMRFVRDNYYVRPFLDTPKAEVMQYVYENQIPYVDDETNHTTIFSRNLIRNKVFPDLRLVWPNVEQALAEFGAICRQDDDYINTMVDLGGMVVKDNLVKLPLTYFIYNASIVSRVLYNAFAKLGVTSDIERKHIQMLTALAKNGMNGAKLDLPHECRAFKEYEYLTIARAKPKMSIDTEWPFKLGVTNIAEFGKIKIKRSKDHIQKLGMLLIDLDKIPEGAVWRMRREGDFIQKFGGGTKTLKAYLIDKKIPQRIRDITPVLAYGNDILIVAGVDISDKLKVSPNSKNVADVQYISQN